MLRNAVFSAIANDNFRDYDDTVPGAYQMSYYAIEAVTSINLDDDFHLVRWCRSGEQAREWCRNEEAHRPLLAKHLAKYLVRYDVPENKVRDGDETVVAAAISDAYRSYADTLLTGAPTTVAFTDMALYADAAREVAEAFGAKGTGFVHVATLPAGLAELFVTGRSRYPHSCLVRPQLVGANAAATLRNVEAAVRRAQNSFSWQKYVQ